MFCNIFHDYTSSEKYGQLERWPTKPTKTGEVVRTSKDQDCKTAN